MECGAVSPCSVVNKYLVAEQLAIFCFSASKGQLQSKHFHQVDIEDFPQYSVHLEDKFLQRSQTRHCLYILLLEKVQVESGSSAILQLTYEDMNSLA